MDSPLPERLEDTWEAAKHGLRRRITWIRHLDEGTVDLDRAAVERNFKQAHAALERWWEDREPARRVLLEIARDGTAAISPGNLCRVYVYLGYLADREVKRQEAMSWYTKALEIKHGGAIQEVAKQGLDRPVTWIKQLDGRETPPPPPYVMWEQYALETSKVPAPPDTLSHEERVRNFDILATALEQVCGMFELKGIDWPQVVARYRQRVDEPQTTEEFYFLLHQLVAELRDSHSFVCNYQLPPHLSPSHGPRLGVRMLGDGVYVTRVPEGSEAERIGVKVGSEIIEIDGMTVKERLEQLRAILRGFSSERAFRRLACRRLLSGREDTTVRVKLKAPEGQTSEITLPRDVRGAVLTPRTYPLEVTRQKLVNYGRHPSGVGYIHIRGFSPDQSTADQFETALTDLRRTPALMLDIRDNGGGGGASWWRIVSRFITERTLVRVSYDKNYHTHRGLHRREVYLTPREGWKYLKPVALLTNYVTGSAADVFASMMRAAEQVVTVGSTTHGNTGGGGTYILLPCNLVVWVSTGYAADATDKPIEGNGHEPDVYVEPTISDVLNGVDPVIDKAVEVLQAAIASQP